MPVDLPAIRSMARRGRVVAALVCISALLLLLATAWYDPSTKEAAQTLYRSASFPKERVVEDYDFLHSEKETTCFIGLKDQGNMAEQSTRPDTIPNIVHFIYLSDPEVSRIPFTTFLSINAALQRIRPEKIKLHHTYLDPQTELVKDLIKHDVELVHHDPSSIVHLADGARNKKWNLAHLADLLRLDILEAEGGIYLDGDVFALRSFDSIRESPRDVVLGYEGGDRHGLCNAVILSRKQSSFLKRWRGTYSSFSTHEWNEHSVILPKDLAADYPEEICTLAPEVFFWPTWTHRHVAFMHGPLNDVEAAYVDHSIKANNGSLWPDQLAYHAWSQVSKSYLESLTPELIMSQNTRFNMMVRSFLAEP